MLRNYTYIAITFVLLASIYCNNTVMIVFKLSTEKLRRLNGP